jgi:iron complex transport system substrate-binding protein
VNNHRSRTILYVVLASMLLLIFAGCSNGQSNSASLPQSSPISSEAPNVADEQAPVEQPTTKIYAALNGGIEVPVKPEKVVSLVFVGELLALGVQPIGTGTAFLETGLFVEELKGSEPIGNEPSVEKILELEPELIIMHNFIGEEVIAQLSKIAPTVVMPFNDRGPVERLEMFADLLDRQEEAEQFLLKYEEKAAAAKAELADYVGADETVAYYEIWGKSLWVMGEANGRGVYNLYHSLGLTPPAKVQQDVVELGKGIDISLELLPEYAADHMFVGVYAGDGGAERAEELMQSALWKNLPAVKQNQVYLINIDEFSPSDIHALYKQLDLQLEILSANR